MSFEPAPSRRTVLRAAVLSALATSGCTSPSDSDRPSRSTAGRASLTPTTTDGVTASPPTGATSSAPTRADWAALAGALDGDVLRRNDGGYRQGKQLFDPRFDDKSPLAVIEAGSAHDVSEAIGFARRFDLPARPRAGGHSYVGASTVDDGLIIDVARLQQVRYDAGSRLGVVGAGARLYDVHAALAQDGRTIATGTCPTVGAAGLSLGGGLGVDSRRYGLTCDRLRAVTIVTADGQMHTATRSRNADLLWACRGGGGGNVGIVTSLTFTTHPATSFGFFLVSFPWSAAARVVLGWSRRVVVMPRTSWMNLHLEAGSDGSTRARVVGICAAGEEDDEAAAIEAAVGVDATSSSTFEKSFLDGIEFLGGGTTSSRQSFAAGSDVLPHMTPSLAHRLTGLVAQRAASRRGAAAILDPLTGAVQDVPPASTAFAWRRHLADIQWYLSLPSAPSRSDVSAAYDWIDSAHEAVGASSAGGYVNYLEPGRAVASYYGANITRLRQVKSKYDPDSFFRSSYTV